MVETLTEASKKETRTDHYWALINPDRRSILTFLSTGPKTPSEIMDTLHFPQSKVSKQLNYLYARNMIHRVSRKIKRGRKYEYSINKEVFDEMISELCGWKQPDP